MEPSASGRPVNIYNSRNLRFMERENNMENEKILLNVEETAQYLNLGLTKTRELMKENEKVFVIKIGNRRYAHKLLLDKWLVGQIRK